MKKIFTYIAMAFMALTFTNCSNNDDNNDNNDTLFPYIGSWEVVQAVSYDTPSSTIGSDFEEIVGLVFTFATDKSITNSMENVVLGKGKYSYKEPVITIKWEDNDISNYTVVSANGNTMVIESINNDYEAEEDAYKFSITLQKK